MKVKEKMWETRGRPRKFRPGEAVVLRFRAPDVLLAELRMCARAAQRSLNDEVTARLMASFHYQTDKPIIHTRDGQRIISLVSRFEEWLTHLTGLPEDDSEDYKENTINDVVWVWRQGKRIPLKGKILAYTMRIPENLADEIRIVSRLHKRSINEELLTRMMESLDYFSERFLEQNEDTQALKALSVLFDEFIKEKLAEAEKVPLPWEKEE